MKYRKLGKSGIIVSEIGFGAWTIGLDWWGKKIEDDEATKMLKRAYDLGITFYDTADLYGKGRSEKLIGKAFKDTRNEIIYSTKWGYDFYNAEQIGHNELPQLHDSTFLTHSLERSLERLQTDYVDVYSLHNPKMQAIENIEIFSSLEKIMKDGTIRSHGVALGPAIGWENEGMLAMRERSITCLQTVYNILEQDPGKAFMKESEKYDVGIMTRVPDASGVLTGKVNENTVFEKNDHRSSRKREWIIGALKKVENLKPFAAERGWGVTELAMKFILSQRQVSVILPTITSLEELENFASFSDGNYLNSRDLGIMSDMYANNFNVEPIQPSQL
ncbi:MAG: aldo/keto reductase [Thermoproteota archaeon]|nr:aldo/keto reductase [Thermoproteota archaeon]